MLADQEQDARHFNPWRVPNTERAIAAVRRVQQAVEAVERRVRSRKQRDQANFEAAIAALVCDLIYRHVVGSSDQRVVVDRSNRTLERKKSRYDHRAMTGTFRVAQDLLAKAGFVGIKLGIATRDSGVRTTIWAKRPLLQLLPEATPQDFALDSSEEVLILRAPKHRKDEPGTEIDYEDDHFTRKSRDELRALNTHIARADISVDDHVVGLVDTSKRRLFRIFADGQFDRGGRLYRGFWIDMPSEVRSKMLRIRGQRIVTLDYGQMAPRLAYASLGKAPPPGDLYQIGRLNQYPREGIKTVMNAAIHSSGPLRRKPDKTAQHFIGRTIREILDDIRTAHAPIAPAMECGAGLGLQRLESEIVLASLTRLMQKGVVALPVHDALIVAKEDADHAHQVMAETFGDLTGIDAVITRE